MGTGGAVESLSSSTIREFLESLGARYPKAATIYILGGSALCLLGSRRETLDIDYNFELRDPGSYEFEDILRQLGEEMRLDLEVVPLEEFIPLPPDSHNRRRFIGKYGQVEAYIYDLYSIALSKIARGFEADFEDVEFMIHQGLIILNELEKYFTAILPDVHKTDITPSEFMAYFQELKRRLARDSTVI
jgi:hypothetical protein